MSLHHPRRWSLRAVVRCAIVVTIITAGCGGQPAPVATSNSSASPAPSRSTTAPTGAVIDSVIARQGDEVRGTASHDLRSPWGVAVDRGGNVYVSDVVSNVVVRIAPDHTTAVVAKGLNGPRGLVVDASGSLYVANTLSNEVVKIDAAGAAVRMAGTGSYSFSGDGGPAPAAALAEPHGLALDRDGSLYIADRGNHRVRKVAVDGTITTVAGTGTRSSAGDGGPATAASLAAPIDVAVDGSGSLFVSEASGTRVRRVGPDGLITTSSADLERPSGLVVHEGVLYIADEAASLVYAIPSGGPMRVVAGNGVQGFSGDGGPPAEASLANPIGLAVDGMGRLLIVDTTNIRVRRVTL